ncbi:metal-dependent hydrolase [Rhodococcus triatomae]|uniref:LexA-binding, inner membrane-associated putative hydrolase n=1 Tax=Rhodococcus triatomae TaxID=300028 RepID=A0A1G8IHN8_9NOCA|nr:metal-dependent hydrolase [Rhodococcus triatomae]QNG21052.1 metal-dependent hydrolase [Rhodococcus triatomae]QNG23034.1 metal-dependent hydrolase [Rhodococcus triatomae]SDI18040.1 LexA-binding, inner membrane-associated putative hydrolase [Rhodococcus triatomae]
MVMGPTHAMSGAAVGLAVADLLPPDWGGPTSTPETFTFAAVCAGAALFPDLDTPQSTVSRSFGPISRLFARVVDSVSLGYYSLTRGKKDGKRRGGHRTLTHTALFAAAVGAGVSALVIHFGKPAIIGILFFFLGLALRGLAGNLAKEKGWIVVSAVAVILSALTWQWYPSQAGSTGLGVAVALGCATHCLGDAITKEGVPFLAPFVPWRQERWWELKLPSFLSIRAGGAFEKAVLGPALTIGVVMLAVWAVDGAPQAIYDAFVPAYP